MIATGLNTETVRLYRMSSPEHECPWGLRAVKLLKDNAVEFEDHKLTSQTEIDAFKAQHEVTTTPQIFFGNERIGGYNDLAERFGVPAEKAVYSYSPVVALFGTAGLVAWAATLGIPGFMGMALAMLANQKLMDLESFVESFEKYDLISQQVKPYGKTFPFLELLLGLGFLSGVAPVVTGIGSLILGTSGTISAFKAVYIDKLKLNCACIGGNSNAPLGIVSVLENAIMVVMGAVLLFGAAPDIARWEVPTNADPEHISIRAGQDYLAHIHLPLRPPFVRRLEPLTTASLGRG
ncbi:MAG: glutaredoxin [Leptolyngbya sp. RL_3_1]|nr:glutaredoxin [Leptolyngbya sp. RL_3_1]